MKTAHAIREWIRGGRFVRGEKLPAETSWAELLGVSRDTLRSALEHLQAEGWVERRKYQGFFAAGPSGGPASPLLSDTVVMVTRLHPAEGPPGSAWMKAVDLAAQAELDRNHLDCLSLYPADGMRGILRKLSLSSPRAVLIAHGAGESRDIVPLLHLLKEKRIPVVPNGDAPWLAECDRVVSDHRAGAAALTRWLLEQGCRRMLRVHAHPTDTYWVRERNEGHEAVLREAGLAAPPPCHISPPVTRDQVPSTREAFEGLYRQLAGHLVEHLGGPNRPEALVCITDSIAYLAAAACRLFGLVPNRDILIAGYDAYWRHCWEQQFEPDPLCVTVDKRNEAVGRRMVERITERIAGHPPPSPRLDRMACDLLPVGPDGGRTALLRKTADSPGRA